MSIIRAKGRCLYGYKIIEIVGNKKVESITSSDTSLEAIVERSIKNGDGIMANGYSPPPMSMLQAYATLLGIFDDYRDVTVDGDIGTIPHQTGVIF